MCRILKLILLGLFLNISCIQSQTNSVSEKFRELSRPEKCWVFKHPFVAKKTWLITQKVIAVCDSIANVNTLDRDKNGGQVDAFRHAYWMALLSQQIGRRRGLKLGYAHERANYIDYKRNRLEDGSHPDKASKEMDLFNNKRGAQIGKENKKLSEIELQILIIDAIVAGKMKVIKKDTLGNYLDANNNIIPADSLKGKWKNNKCLVSSIRRK